MMSRAQAGTEQFATEPSGVWLHRSFGRAVSDAARYTRDMPRGRSIHSVLALILGCAALLLAGTGCASDSPGPSVLTVPRAQYERAFEAACEAARLEGLVPELADRQSGVVSTGPRLAGSALEPWKWGELTASDIVEGTFGFERRRAHFEFVPVGFSPTSSQPSAPLAGASLPGAERTAPADLEKGDGPIELRVSVSVERQFREGYQGSAYTRALGSYWRDATAAGTSGRDATWTPIARDERFERLLLARIVEQLAAAK